MRRSLLFLPGNSPNMLMNGDVLGADALILDLEDAVPPDEKDAARILVRHALGALDYGAVEVIVRINPPDMGDHWRRDLEEIVPLRPDFLMPTKVAGAETVRAVSEAVGEIERACGLEPGAVRLLPLIETALGLENAFAVAAADPRVAGLLLGAEDLTADLRCPRTRAGAEIAYARGRIVCAARAAGVEAYDTPFTDVDDPAGLEADAALGRALGFSGKAVISPRHVKAVNRAFSPSPGEVEYAREVLEAIREAEARGRGAASLRGKMIDAPIVARARQVLEMEEAIRSKGGAE